MEGIGENERTTEKDRKGQIRQKDRKRQRDKLTDGRDTLYKLAERETNSRERETKRGREPRDKGVLYFFVMLHSLKGYTTCLSFESVYCVYVQNTFYNLRMIFHVNV